jgi:hypothetical protein
MTDEQPAPDAPPVPCDVDALAEFDAGLPDPARAARGRAVAAADPRAAAVLEALAATRSDLAALADPAVPPAVAARWSTALAAESASAHRPAGPDRRAVPGRRRRRAAAGTWLAAAAVVAVAGAGLGVLAKPAAPAAPSVRPVELVALARATVGTTDVGDLADPTRRAACLAAVAPAAAGERLLGGRSVVLDGRPGVLLVLATGTRGGLRIVTVDPTCGPAGGTLLAQLVVG